MALFYAEVSEEDRVSSGGGVAAEGEMIEVVELTLDEVKDYLKTPNYYSETYIEETEEEAAEITTENDATDTNMPNNDEPLMEIEA